MKDIEPRQQAYLNTLIERYPVLKSCEKDLTEAYCLLRDSYKAGGKLLIAGNGGSAADAEHISGELMKSFKLKRPLPESLVEKLMQIHPEKGVYLSKTLEMPLTAIPLLGNDALNTAYINDVGGPGFFAQQLLGLGNAGDVFLGISTSGNSEDVLYAAVLAKAMDMKVIALTGAGGGKLKPLADVSICVPETETYMIQELHLPVYHCLCLMLENYFWG
ncbi:SIS domain-containing protein [Megasphaera elsdenii]|uniref:D-sedoheptulose-7-phosphate isomerase n=1 Tax=Megasphaera elsdenii TaxID=907 RepID=UPI00051413E1|nr:SIS domain-containing protein [Megasphaera elsdenii]KGI89642.1 phosphoheptose isomerase [Megasphaera elsdenii]